MPTASGGRLNPNRSLIQSFRQCLVKARASMEGEKAYEATALHDTFLRNTLRCRWDDEWYSGIQDDVIRIPKIHRSRCVSDSSDGMTQQTQGSFPKGREVDVSFFASVSLLQGNLKKRKNLSFCSNIISIKIRRNSRPHRPILLEFWEIF